MKKIGGYTCCFFLIGISSVLAQFNAHEIDNNEYDRLKSESMLRGNEAISFTPPTTDNYRVIPSASQIASVGCEYWITRDASWSIAQFACATATPPQYRNDDCSTGE